MSSMLGCPILSVGLHGCGYKGYLGCWGRGGMGGETGLITYIFNVSINHFFLV